MAWRAASSMICSRRVLKNGLVSTQTAATRCWTSAAKAGSNSRSLLALAMCNSSPSVRAAASTSFICGSAVGRPGLNRPPITRACGISSRSNSSRFATTSTMKSITLVILPPGRLRLATRPSRTGSDPTTKTIGIVEDAAFAARARDLRQFDDLVHARDAVIDRDLEDRMLFLDPQSGCFRRFIGRVRGFRLPIHLQAKSAALRLLALRHPLRDGFLRRGWHGYGLGPLSRRRRHLMISLCCRFLVVAVTDVYRAAVSAERRAIE